MEEEEGEEVVREVGSGGTSNSGRSREECSYLFVLVSRRDGGVVRMRH